MADTSLRMRPYFIPERSRTKSETSAEPESFAVNYTCTSGSSGGGAGSGGGGGGIAGNNFYTDPMNSNSNSMMETCDAYLSSECSGGASGGSSGGPHSVYNNGFTTFYCNQVLPNTHFLNSNQYFRPIKCASLTGQLKKCKSLESVRVETIDGSQPSHEMEFVSSRIQKLNLIQN